METKPLLFPVVGIGASAGGLEPLEELVGNLPLGIDLAVAIVQHSDPTHETLLPEILARRTKLKVSKIQNGQSIQPKQIYICPSDSILTVKDGNFELTPREKTLQPVLAIDQFFRSLASEYQNRAIAVILSGTGSDGSLGIRETKEKGGITFAQSEESAKYPSMPLSAIATGTVDFILSPSDIATQLERITTHEYLRSDTEAKEPALAPEGVKDFQPLLKLIFQNSGVDFSEYKHGTVSRRILRRMALHNFKNLTEFTQFLMENPEALKAVSQDILIQVTKFFREPELFDLLKEKVFPSLITKQRGNDPIRIWVPGCCSGEEVYSILICLIEFLEEGGHRNAIQIFGTDLSESAVQKAREATYIENITLDVSEARLARFFTKVGTHYELHKSLRDMCIFAKHNVVKDPPFGKLDLISCRNLLIYLETPLQNRVLSLFHYALKAKGILVLGNAETVAGVSELYSVIDSRNRIYEKKQQVHRLSYDFLGTQLTANRIAISSAPTLHLESASRGIQMQRDADRFLMGEYCPPSVLIDENLEIVQFRGQTGPYFEHSPGFASFSLLGMLKEGLGGEVRKALEVAQTKKTSCRKEGLTLLSQGQSLKVAIEVFPMALPTTGECYYILIFENMDSPSFKTSAIRRKIKSAGKVRENEAQELTFLRAELASTKEYLQSINEEKEATNEELKAANEEIMSSNEELQSTNEELNSAKEELQSTNEELMTVNDELKLRNQDLSLLNDDLSNLFNSLNSAVVLLNKDLKVRRFTPLAKDLLRLLPGDVGRSILDIRPNVEIKDLQKLLFLVIATGIPKELEIQEPQGIWYSVQLKSYRTSQNKIDGAVILFTDVTKIKTA